MGESTVQQMINETALIEAAKEGDSDKVQLIINNLKEEGKDLNSGDQVLSSSSDTQQDHLVHMLIIINRMDSQQ